MRTVSLPRHAAHAGNLILVNGAYALGEGRCEKSLVPVGGGGNRVLLERRTAAVLRKLLDDVGAAGEIALVSGFRSRQEQARIYATSLLENGAEFTAKYVARPGHSEHQCGLAIDLALNQPDIDALRPHFPYTGICGAFRERAARYGFVERYPHGKERITGIAHEPWHFRYVGVPHANLMQAMGVTLEEYLLRLKEHPYGRAPLRYALDGAAIEIGYLAAGAEAALLEVDDHLPYRVSGDNMGGFIITQWRTS